MPSVFHLLPVKTPGLARIRQRQAMQLFIRDLRGCQRDPGGGTTATGTSAEGPRR